MELQNMERVAELAQEQNSGNFKLKGPGEPSHDDNQSIYSGGSGLAPSLVSHTINYFPQGKFGNNFMNIFQEEKLKKTIEVLCKNSQMKVVEAQMKQIPCMSKIPSTMSNFSSISYSFFQCEQCSCELFLVNRQRSRGGISRKRCDLAKRSQL